MARPRGVRKRRHSPDRIREAARGRGAEAEKGSSRWREEKPKTGHEALDALKTALEGKRWERGDRATAKLVVELLLVIESRDAGKIAEKLAKMPPQPGTIPKF
jgi:hypothetical protein